VCSTHGMIQEQEGLAMKRIMMFTVLLGFTVLVTLTLEGSSHRAGNLPETLAGFLNESPQNFSSAGQLWDPDPNKSDLMLSSEFHRFEGIDAIVRALHERYSDWHVEIAGSPQISPQRPAQKSELFEPKVLAIQKPAPKQTQSKVVAPKAPPLKIAYGPGINRPDIEFVSWIYRAKQGAKTRIELYTAIAQRRAVKPAMGPSDHEHSQQWRFLTVRELPAPSPLP
jgi:hypothetical protein